MGLLIFTDAYSLPNEFIPVESLKISIYEVYLQFQNLIKEKTLMLKLLAIARSI